MPRPKPPEPYHLFNLRLPLSIFRLLSERARKEGNSINKQVRIFVEDGLSEVVRLLIADHEEEEHD